MIPHIFTVLVRMRWLAFPTVCGTPGIFSSPCLTRFCSTFPLSTPPPPTPHPSSCSAQSKLTQHFHAGLYECAQVIIVGEGGRGGRWRIRGEEPQHWKKDEEGNKRKINHPGSHVTLRSWDVCPGQQAAGSSGVRSSRPKVENLRVSLSQLHCFFFLLKIT